MSSLLTTPLISNTEIERKPLQILENKSVAQQIEFGAPTNQIRYNTLQVQQLKFSDFALKDKIVTLNEWKTSDTGIIWELELDNAFLTRYIQVIDQNYMFFKVDKVRFKIKANINSFYQGLLWLIYEPTPQPQWASRVYRRSLGTEHYSQLERLEITPNSQGEFEFTIPLIHPFGLFTTKINESDTKTGPEKIFSNYAKTYSYGRIYALVVNQLVTNNPLAVPLSYPLSVSLEGVTYGGTLPLPYLALEDQ